MQVTTVTYSRAYNAAYSILLQLPYRQLLQHILAVIKHAIPTKTSVSQIKRPRAGLSFGIFKFWSIENGQEPLCSGFNLQCYLFSPLPPFPIIIVKTDEHLIQKICDPLAVYILPQVDVIYTCTCLLSIIAPETVFCQLAHYYNSDYIMNICRLIGIPF